MRICVCERPDSPTGIAEALEAGGLQFRQSIGLWSQPGVFSWDRIDPGTALLVENLGPFDGVGADFGCGVGALARSLLKGDSVRRLILLDLDWRAIEAARRNIVDPRAQFVHADLRREESRPRDLDFVVMNPPFHAQGGEDRGLGQMFVRAAAAALRPGGRCRLVANVTLPYEKVMAEHFSSYANVLRQRAFKILEAVR